MSKIAINIKAPDFQLTNFRGEPVRLSDFQGKKHVLLVFNRGFMCVFCRAHAAKLRQDYEKFVAENAEVIIVGPDNADAFADYWQKETLPFVGLPDPKHSVLKQYGQEVNLFKLGRMPAQLIIDKEGVARFVHYGNSMRDIPETAEVLAILRSLNEEN